MDSGSGWMSGGSWTGAGIQNEGDLISGIFSTSWLVLGIAVRVAVGDEHG